LRTSGPRLGRCAPAAPGSAVGHGRPPARPLRTSGPRLDRCAPAAHGSAATMNNVLVGHVVTGAGVRRHPAGRSTGRTMLPRHVTSANRALDEGCVLRGGHCVAPEQVLHGPSRDGRACVQASRARASCVQASRDGRACIQASRARASCVQASRDGRACIQASRARAGLRPGERPGEPRPGDPHPGERSGEPWPPRGPFERAGGAPQAVGVASRAWPPPS
jgi:hypothetical protein